MFSKIEKVLIDTYSRVRRQQIRLKKYTFSTQVHHLVQNNRQFCLMKTTHQASGIQRITFKGPGS